MTVQSIIGLRSDGPVEALNWWEEVYRPRSDALRTAEPNRQKEERLMGSLVV